MVDNFVELTIPRRSNFLSILLEPFFMLKSYRNLVLAPVHLGLIVFYNLLELGRDLD